MSGVTTMERKAIPVEWKAAAHGTVRGYASTFGNVDRGGDVVMPGAFTESVQRIKAEGIPLLADHAASVGAVLGTITDAEEDDHGLVIQATFASTDDAQSARRKLLEGHLRSMSIGYEVVDAAYGELDGREVRFLNKVTLWETSVVVFPMNPAAVVVGAKSAASSTDLGLAIDLLAAEVEIVRLM